ncbi:nicotinate-nucleotide--dimethylbenzimidazole phosphoribosyltransferase [Lysinibacillus sp. NPDC096418]|uniref:nicotinate-nucleotide--dimethylbenzimidazole phosphoribosyltransferase n=1 Tax=Lysinibacillus sp. NPDC096418 TaxID=3364138 RepID=UPI00382A7088
MLSFTVQSLDEAVMEEARQYINSLTKPPGSLGRLEDIAIQLAGMTGQIKPDITPGILVFAADHGVVAENVSASPQSVTREMAINMVEGGAGISVFGKMIGAAVDVYDVGMLQDVSSEKVIKKKVRMGTGNIVKECAMTVEEAWKTIEIGYEAAKQAIARDVRCLIVGELGIGNTTTSSAILSVLLDIDPQSVVGRGSGINDQQLQNKIEVCREAISHHQPKKHDAIDILSKIGGLDIAAMTGAMIAAAELRVPILLDGFICTVSACLAKLLAPGSEHYMLVSHQSVEPGHISASELLGKRALIGLDLRLGEGTGAAIAYPIVQAANVMVKNMATFDSANVSQN